MARISNYGSGCPSLARGPEGVAGLAFNGANIWVIAPSIGLTTFLLATVGMVIGRMVGRRFGKVVELLGGLALVGLGLTILLEHLGVLGA
ncbi:manganese efflux pump [uncultured Brevundimonas sp.]|uniref:manganese efflux pump n=1 Tax=uncultured Brevundimonas sp. TaxID=213418 RepID=UPI0030EED416